jgi:hypothetical protein
VDPNLFETIASGAALAAEFLKVRGDRHEAVDAKAFRHWLEHDAMPRLMQNSDGILHAVATLKATNQERFDQIQALLVDIHRAVAAPSAQDTWERLTAVDQGILRALFRAVRDDPFIGVKPDELQSALNAEMPELLKSARFLKERNLLILHEHTRGWSVSPQAAGVWLAWAAEAAVDHAAAVRRLRELLISETSTTRLRTLADETTVPEGLAYYVIRTWADAGLLTFEDNASPYYMGRINVTESFRRSERITGDR